MKRPAALVLAVVALVLSATAAYAHHGDMPRPHWPTGHRVGIPIINRALSPVVLEAAWDINQIAPELVTYGNYTEGGDPDDCSRVDGAVVVCRGGGGPVTATFGNDHLGACVVLAGYFQNDRVGMTHELLHCLGLGHHGSYGGIMGDEGRITDLDRQALVQVYSHTDGPPLTTAPPTTTTLPPAGPTTTTTRPVYTPPPERQCLRLVFVLCL